MLLSTLKHFPKDSSTGAAIGNGKMEIIEAL